MNNVPSNLVSSGFSRVFLLKNRAAPSRPPVYEGLMRAGAVTLDQGKLTQVYVPDPTQYGKFLIAGKIPGEPGLPQITLDAMYSTDLSDLLKMVNDGCDHDIQIHMGQCKDPQDFNGGWDKVMILEAARENSYSTTDLGALMPSQNAEVTETGKFEGQLLYEVKSLNFSEKAALAINDPIVDIIFCDAPTCGACGIVSDGCQVIFAVSKASTGSPGLLATIVYSLDGGLTWFNDPIDSMATTTVPTSLACVGPNLVVAGVGVGAAVGFEYAAVADIIAGTEVWTEVLTGFVTAHGPKAIFSLNSTFTLVAGVGGYIYSTTDPTSGVQILDAGVATIQDLNAIDAIDLENFVIVGNNNSVVNSTDGGVTWQSITGPLAGSTLTCVAMLSRTEWFVGVGSGRLFYTLNSGLTWAEKTFPGSGGSSTVRDIKFATASVGYMAHSTSTKGRILRTIDGGNSWYVMPKSGVMPAQLHLDTIAVCPNVNKIVAGGTASNNVDGIIVLGA